LRVDAGEVLVAAEDVGGAVLVGLGRREDRAGEAADRVVERAVLRRARRLGELDVVDDLARAEAAQLVEDVGMPGARVGPALLLGVVREGRGVDADDREVLGPVGRAQLEAQRDRRVLE
jgi:hypothetical protein